MNLNVATFIGNLTDTPELKTLDGGSTRAKFNVAVNRTWKDKAGEKQEEASFIPVVVWGGSAENCAKWLTKGQQVAVRGRIRTYKYDKDGETRYGFEVVADDVQFGSKPRGHDEAAAGEASDDGAPF